MAEYIEREAALEAAKKSHLYFDIKPIINSIPVADVRPVVRGKWIDTDNYYQRWKCSACGCHTRDARPPFCPNCGARMEER